MTLVQLVQLLVKPHLAAVLRKPEPTNEPSAVSEPFALPFPTSKFPYVASLHL